MNTKTHREYFKAPYSLKPLSTLLLIATIILIYKLFGPQSYKAENGMKIKYEAHYFGNKPHVKFKPMIILLNGAPYSNNNILTYLNENQIEARIIDIEPLFTDIINGDHWIHTKKSHQPQMNTLTDALSEAIINISNTYPTLGKPFLIGSFKGANIALALGLKFKNHFSKTLLISGDADNGYLNTIPKITHSPPFIFYEGTQNHNFSQFYALSNKAKKKGAFVKFKSYKMEKSFTRDFLQDFKHDIYQHLKSF